PYSSVPDVNKARNKVLVLPGKVKKPGPAYRKTVEAQSGNLEQDVWDQMMKAPVTLSAEHWLATSPSMHSKMKSYVIPKRVPTKQMIVNDVTGQESGVETEDQQWDLEPLPPIEDKVSHLEGCIHINELLAVQFYVTTMQQGLILAGTTIIQDPVVQYLESLPAGEKLKPIVAVGTVSESLRAVYPLVSGRRKMECLCDSGSQIVSCSVKLAKQMGWEYDLDVFIMMESTNWGVERSLGLVPNVTFLFGDVTIYLQVHVLANLAYELLLGCPFDTLTESEVKNTTDRDQMLILTDPNTRKQVKVHTYLWGKPPQILQWEPESGFQSSRI
ncbi:hypothetical protein IW262DRAFT_1274075, partial [Armillaria fumosa]